jgi:phosphatidylglycerophosphatase A
MNFAKLIATWFGLGLIPVAPGTWGTLGGLAVAWPLAEYAGWPSWSFGPLAIACTAPGIWAADQTAKAAGKKDPGIVVVDEVLGMWLTLAGMSTTAPVRQWVLAFALFRILDIWKPYPVRKLESLAGGTGIVADDLGAGVYGALVLVAVRAFGLV